VLAVVGVVLALDSRALAQTRTAVPAPAPAPAPAPGPAPAPAPAPSAATATALPALNSLLRDAATACRAQDAAALVRLDAVLARHSGGAAPGPEMTARIRRGLADLEADPVRAPVLDAMDGFPLIDDVPDVLASLSVQVTRRLPSARDPEGRIACRLGFERVAGKWMLGAISAPRATDDAFDIGTFYASGPVPPRAFDRVDPTDLRDVVRAAEARKPRLGALVEAMPSIRGFWRLASDARVTLATTDGVTARLHFAATAPGAWKLAEE
jgi:hypothetical protein